MLLNLVETSNAENKETLWKFVCRFHNEINPKNLKIFDSLIDRAIKYFKDKLEPSKVYKKPNLKEKKALEKLIDEIEKINQGTQPEEIQTIVYKIGKENGYETNLREWFKLIYQVCFGEENGPRMGFFISFFGVKETVKLLQNKIK